ncbi:MAG: Lrp/AsnC family transcriptional regulator, partial [Burkholderiales bacterium]
MDALRFSLLNDYQRGFPLAAEPYRALARKLNVAEAAVIGALLELRRAGAISRIGATFRPGAVG